MDKMTVIGLFIANFVMALGIVIGGASFSAFWDTPSILMVFGGGFAAVMIAFPIGPLLTLPGVVKKIVFPNVQPMAPTIKQLIEFAEIARRDGILSLENKTSEIKDPFILMGVQMAIDGTDAEVMEAVMRSEVETMAGRHKQGKTIMETTARYAPAFGMIGTLIGLVIMLGNMDDPAAIGPGMAVALLTTLYGAYLANAMCLPFADKLGYYSRKEQELREVIIRGLLAIQQGDNPRVIEQKLVTFLPAKQRSEVMKKKDAA